VQIHLAVRIVGKADTELEKVTACITVRLEFVTTDAVERLMKVADDVGDPIEPPALSFAVFRLLTAHDCELISCRCQCNQGIAPFDPRLFALVADRDVKVVPSLASVGFAVRILGVVTWLKLCVPSDNPVFKRAFFVVFRPIRPGRGLSESGTNILLFVGLGSEVDIPGFENLGDLALCKRLKSCPCNIGHLFMSVAPPGVCTRGDCND